MKKILSIIKYIHHFTNHTVTPEQEANDIWEYMIKRSNPIHTLEVFKALEARAELEMKAEEKRCAEICKAVNSKWKPQPVKPRYYDPNFDKSLNELEISY